MGRPVRDRPGRPRPAMRGGPGGRPRSRPRLAANGDKPGTGPGRAAGSRDRVEPQAAVVAVPVPDRPHPQARRPAHQVRPRRPPPRRRAWRRPGRGGKRLRRPVPPPPRRQGLHWGHAHRHRGRALARGRPHRLGHPPAPTQHPTHATPTRPPPPRPHPRRPPPPPGPPRREPPRGTFPQSPPPEPPPNVVRMPASTSAGEFTRTARTARNRRPIMTSVLSYPPAAAAACGVPQFPPPVPKPRATHDATGTSRSPAPLTTVNNAAPDHPPRTVPPQDRAHPRLPADPAGRLRPSAGH